MSSISLAAGGEDIDYDMVAYVGKDKRGTRGMRASFVVHL
jgi:hypothetical protein